MRESWAAIRYEDDRAVAVALLTADFTREGEMWLTECLELGTAAYAPTLEGASAELSEAVQLQLTQVQDLGFIDEFLKEHGVRLLPIVPTQGRPSRRGSFWETLSPVSA